MEIFSFCAMYIRKEGRNFTTVFKENYAIAWDSWGVFTKNMLSMKLNMVLIVLLEFAYIGRS